MTSGHLVNCARRSCEDSVSARKQVWPNVPVALQHAENDEGHVVALWGAGGEGIGCLHDSADSVFGGKAVTRFDGVEPSLLAPFFSWGLIASLKPSV